jgi:hypothetical protein
MLAQEQHPFWEANYKSMSSVQLVAELERLARFPHLYDNTVERKGCIGVELALRVHTRPAPIIVLESD